MVGVCPNHKFVAGKAIENRFPAAAKCKGCGEKLEEAKPMKESVVEQEPQITTEFED